MELNLPRPWLLARLKPGPKPLDMVALELHTRQYPNDYQGQLAYADCLREHGYTRDADRIQAWVSIMTGQSPEPEE